MPELPEVETTLRGIKDHVENQLIKKMIIRHYGLRWPIPPEIVQKLQRHKILQLTRRGKYLLFKLQHGTMMIHLGMSGRIHLLQENTMPKKHDHVDIIFNNNTLLRFTDPRRFGALLWTEENINLHPLLKNLGPEPLEKSFSGKYLWQLAHSKKVPIKTCIMDSKIVVGVGNIYANEALFSAKIHPCMPTNQLSVVQANQLAQAIKSILRQAIKRGGTTLKDFFNSDGKPGYFSNQLQVYGRNELPCLQCKTPLELIRIAQRSTVFCKHCQRY